MITFCARHWSKLKSFCIAYFRVGWIQPFCYSRYHSPEKDQIHTHRNDRNKNLTHIDKKILPILATMRSFWDISSYWYSWCNLWYGKPEISRTLPNRFYCFKIKNWWWIPVFIGCFRIKNYVMNIKHLYPFLYRKLRRRGSWIEKRFM